MSEDLYAQPDLMRKVRREEESGEEMEDRDEREERWVDIYMSADSLRAYDGGTETQPAAEQDRGGGPHAERRRGRVRRVCLGLLYLLLLAGFTFLAIQHIKVMKEENSLLARYQKLSEERDHLQARYQNLTEERDHLQATNSCTDGLIFGCHCYHLSTEQKTWHESREACKERQSDLMIINNQKEQDFFISFSKPVWIGLTDKDKEGEWKWVDGTPLTTAYWSASQPDNGSHPQADEDCAELYNVNVLPKGWNDRTCQEMNYWICERALS